MAPSSAASSSLRWRLDPLPRSLPLAGASASACASLSSSFWRASGACAAQQAQVRARWLAVEVCLQQRRVPMLHLREAWADCGLTDVSTAHVRRLSQHRTQPQRDHLPRHSCLMTPCQAHSCHPCRVGMHHCCGEMACMAGTWLHVQPVRKGRLAPAGAEQLGVPQALCAEAWCPAAPGAGVLLAPPLRLVCTSRSEPAN